MIYLEMYGRLGNQMFRYATVRAIQEKFYPNEEITINFNQIKKINKNDDTFYNALNDFCVKDFKIYKKKGKVIFNETNFFQRICCLMYYLGLRRFSTYQMKEQLDYQTKWKKILNFFGIYWYRIGYCKIEKSILKNKFFSGNFESPQYFSSIRAILLKEFTPKHAPLEKNKELYKLINNTNSICLSVRRGDFENNENIKKLHSLCSKNYFESAIQIAKKKIEKPVFFMFSDDIEWVKENINTGCETYYEDGTDPVWEKLRMMSQCKNFIISNSTFSWWSQWLSQNENKIVISPSRWFNNDYDCPLIDKENWILIDV